MLGFPRMIRPPARAYVRNATVSSSSLALLREGIREVTSRQRLIRYLVSAEMRRRGSDTLLGNLWWILDPLLQMVVYVIFVTIISKRPQADYPLFIFAAILPWKWFNTAVVDSTNSIVSRAGLIRQVAFPKLVLPFATVTSEVVGFAWGLIPLGVIMALYPGRLTLMVLWIPVIAAVQFVFTVGCATLVAAANVYFRDLGNVSTHVLRLWFFLSPGLYSISALDSGQTFTAHEAVRFVAHLNPFAILFEAYRAVIYGTPDGGPPVPPDLVSLGLLLVASTILTGLAIIVFKRLEPDFAKVL